MRALYLAPALLLSVLALTPATAAPVAPLAPLTANSFDGSVIQAQYHRDRNSRYRAGQRYRSAPRGWRRYDRRPGDWRHRGCVLVGPVWFCP